MRDAQEGRTGRIRVVARVRPLIREDVELPEATAHARSGSREECVAVDERRVLLRKPFYDAREFVLDSVLGREATQSETYEVVARGVVDAVLQGYNGTILAYGQTGTGKTHTIYGPLAYWRRGSQPQLELSGIITRAAMQIFAYAEARRQKGHDAAGAGAPGVAATGVARLDAAKFAPGVAAAAARHAGEAVLAAAAPQHDARRPAVPQDVGSVACGGAPRAAAAC